MNLEQFDKVANHLIKQGKRSLAPDGVGCMYRGNDKTKCAIGAIIPDKLYGSHLEGASFSVLVARTRCSGDKLWKHLEPYAAQVPISALKAILKVTTHIVSVSSWGAALQLVHDCVEPAYWPALLAELRTHVEQTA